MGISKLIINNQVKLDLTNDTITPDVLTENIIAHDAYGNQIVGEMIPGYSEFYIWNEGSILRSFDMPVVIDGIDDCSDVLRGCSIFDQPVNIPDYVYDCSNMFDGCYSLNSPITIGKSVVNCFQMFNYCESFNQPITISYNVYDCRNMFYECYSMASNIYIDQNEELLVSNMLTGRSNHRPINIFCNNLSLLTANDAENSIVGNDITWTEITNGYYNSSYNIYLYNNYSVETGLIS